MSKNLSFKKSSRLQARSSALPLLSPNPQSGGIGEFLLGLGFFIAVVAAIAYWIKPWEWIFNALDDRDSERANRLAIDLNNYYNQRGLFPWNESAGSYMPSVNHRRPENAFTFIAGSDQNIDWVENLTGVISVDPDDKTAFATGETFTVLKQVSSGGRVAVCFLPRSTKYRQLAADLCLTDSNGRRDAPYAVAGKDPCAGVDGALLDADKEPIPNLYCAVVE